MLDRTDTDTVRAWLTTALDEAAKRGITPADLARHCSVTAQAVNGWKKTGRITKKNLEKASKFFGHAPSFESSAIAANEPAPNWSFSRVSRAQFESLPVTEKEKIESHILFVISEWSKRSHRPDQTPPSSVANG
jgi:hypothetical protein